MSVIKFREYSEISREKLIVELIVTKKKLRGEQLQSKWLDRLADELREDKSHNKSNKLYQEYMSFSNAIGDELMEKYGIEY